MLFIRIPCEVDKRSTLDRQNVSVFFLFVCLFCFVFKRSENNTVTNEKRNVRLTEWLTLWPLTNVVQVRTPASVRGVVYDQ